VNDEPCLWLRNLWSFHGQLVSWLRVETAVAQAQADAGLIPPEAAFQLATASLPDEQEVLAEEEKTRHDVVAFLWVLKRQLKTEGQGFLHYGLTSSDVVDTALALRLQETMRHFRVLSPLVTQPYFNRAEREIGFGKLSGAVGMHSDYCPPEVEEAALRELGLQVEPVSTQIVSRDRHATMVADLTLASYLLSRIGRGQSAGPAPLLVALENVALWHERDISHSSTERVIMVDLLFHLDRQLHS
jgi:adenylosuccinate lyase